MSYFGNVNFEPDSFAPLPRRSRLTNANEIKVERFVPKYLRNIVCFAVR